MASDHVAAEPPLNDQAPAPEQTEDPATAFLRTIVPSERPERRRAYTTLLRSVVTGRD